MTVLTVPAAFRGPVPQEDADTAPFWDSLRVHRMAIARCRRCRRWIHTPSAYCPSCHVPDVAFEPVSGRATVYTFTVVEREFGLGFDIPYVTAVVELAEQAGLRLATNIVGCEPDEVRIGLEVEVVYHDYPGGPTLAYFTPIGGAK